MEWRHIYFKYLTQWAARCINLGEASTSCANKLCVRTVIFTAQCLVRVGAKTGIYLPNENGGGKKPGFLGTELRVRYLDHFHFPYRTKGSEPVKMWIISSRMIDIFSFPFIVQQGLEDALCGFCDVWILSCCSSCTMPEYLRVYHCI